MKKKIISSLTLVFMIYLCLASTVNAAVISPQASEYLSSYYAYVYPEGSGNVSIWFEVQGTETMDEIGVLTVRLQEKASGSSTWTTVKTYSHTEYLNLLTYNDNFHWSSVNYSGKKGYSYRAYVTIWAGQSGNGDSRVFLTDAIIA